MGPGPQCRNVILAHSTYLWCNSRNIEGRAHRLLRFDGCERQSIVIQRLPIKRTHGQFRGILSSTESAPFHNVTFNGKLIDAGEPRSVQHVRLSIAERLSPP